MRRSRRCSRMDRWPALPRSGTATPDSSRISRGDSVSPAAGPGEAIQRGGPPGSYHQEMEPHGDRFRVLRLIGVGKRFRDVPALSNVNLAVGRGETVAVVGPSGSGKTTLLRCINFLIQYDTGRIFIGDQLVGYRENRSGLVRDTERNINRIRKRIGMVFQRFNLFPHRTVLGNLVEGPLYVLKVGREEAQRRARAALDVVGLTDKVGAYPDQLSGGQQQRVAIARALCME